MTGKRQSFPGEWHRNLRTHRSHRSAGPRPRPPRPAGSVGTAAGAPPPELAPAPPPRRRRLRFRRPQNRFRKTKPAMFGTGARQVSTSDHRCRNTGVNSGECQQRYMYTIRVNLRVSSGESIIDNTRTLVGTSRACHSILDVQRASFKSAIYPARVGEILCADAMLCPCQDSTPLCAVARTHHRIYARNCTEQRSNLV